MKIILNSIAILFLIILSKPLNAQVLRTKSEIIAQKGYDYTSGYTESGNEYIFYVLKGTDKYGDTYSYGTRYIFIELEDIDEPICIVKEIYEPKERTNEIIATLKKDFVKLDYLKYKDYTTSMIYSISFGETENGDEYCIITIYFDEEE